MTKQSRANQLYDDEPHGRNFRPRVLANIIAELGVSKAHASTLYNTARKQSGVSAHYDPSPDNRQNQALVRYIESENAFGKLFPKTFEPLVYPTSRQECKRLFVKLACDLSPENLCCDGELPRAQVQIKYRHLQRCWAALENIFGSTVLEEQAFRWEV